MSYFIRGHLSIFLLQIALAGCSSSQKIADDSAETTRVPAHANVLSMIWPLSHIVEKRLSQGFRLGRRPHTGIDLSAPRGTPIYASHEGYVIYAGNGYNGYGKLIIVEQSDTWATFYSHCDRITVREGDYVQQGEKIGTVGRTGRATGAHLHFEVRRNQVPIDPLRVLPDLF